MRRLLVTTLALLAAPVPGAADAASVYVGADPECIPQRYYPCYDILRVSQDPQDGANDLVVSRSASEYVFRDTLVALRAGEPCRVGSQGDVVCPPFAGSGGGRVEVGPGDDRVVLRGDVPLSVFGGPGDDELRAGTRAHNKPLSGGDGDDVLVGGAGGDVMEGGGGSDRIETGAGSDSAGAGPGTDRIDCGSGTDHAYALDGVDIVRGCEESSGARTGVVLIGRRVNALRAKVSPVSCSCRRVSVRVVAGAATLARARGRVGRRSRTFPLEVTRAGRRRAGRAVTARVVVREGRQPRASWRTVLRVP